MSVTVVKKIVSGKRARVYDIGVATAHHYILGNGVVSHNTMDKYNPQIMGGGGGVKYAADVILMLSKRKEKDGDEVIGNIIHVKVWKSRLSRENKMVDVLLTYDEGLDRYYGCLELAERYGVFKKVSTRYELPDGSKHFGSKIYEDPERFFTPEVLARINEGVAGEFKYGKNEDTTAAEVEAALEAGGSAPPEVDE